MIKKRKKCLKRGLLGILCLVILGGALVACQENERIATHPDQQENRAEESPLEEATPVTEETDVAYRVERRTYGDPMDRHHIAYPVMSGLRGELLQGYMNQSLRVVAEGYASDDTISDMEIDYAVKFMSDDRLSVFFSGRGTDCDGRAIMIRESVNLDIKSSNEILLDNLIKEDAASREQFLELMERWDVHPLENMAVYFEKDHIVFFLSGVSAQTPQAEGIRVPNEEILPIVREDFGTKPAS